MGYETPGPAFEGNHQTTGAAGYTSVSAKGEALPVYIVWKATGGTTCLLLMLYELIWKVKPYPAVYCIAWTMSTMQITCCVTLECSSGSNSSESALCRTKGPAINSCREGTMAPWPAGKILLFLRLTAEAVDLFLSVPLVCG